MQLAQLSVVDTKLFPEAQNKQFEPVKAEEIWNLPRSQLPQTRLRVFDGEVVVYSPASQVDQPVHAVPVNVEED